MADTATGRVIEASVNAMEVIKHMDKFIAKLLRYLDDDQLEEVNAEQWYMEHIELMSKVSIELSKADVITTLYKINEQIKSQGELNGRS
jgi:hypothetical protein